MNFIEITESGSEKVKDSLTELLVSQMQEIGGDPDRSRIQKAVANILKPASRAHIFALADDGEELIACCVVNTGSGIESGGDYVWINELHVKAEFRGQGYGEKLLDEVIRWTKARGCARIMGVTDEANAAARSLFRKGGFIEKGWLWLEKDLTR